jgi:glycosyltransferase involved in cell wall biosynthesis
MKIFRRNHSQHLLLVGVWVNRNWILGNWIREVHKRNQHNTKVKWVLSVFAQKHFWERFVKFPLPNYGAYFFSYPSMFESNLRSNPKRYRKCSIVNYTHNMAELGSFSHQAEILNEAYSVHFNCSTDANILIAHGLDASKVRVVLGAIDEDCRRQTGIDREKKTILLASQFSERKGLDVFPEVVRLLPEWKFLILGRGWEDFLKENKLFSASNVEYQFFDKQSRNVAMSKATIFLSLSKLEGGPIPLIESMSMGVIPIATDTGFAKDVITHGSNGLIIPNPPTAVEVRDAILEASNLKGSPEGSVTGLNWTRISNIVMADAQEIFDAGCSGYTYE